ncbi:MAG: hypothetical protein IJP98_05270 [Clostridia bacterium]|nr:hypothetical protein [Clostridia bacterium]
MKKLISLLLVLVFALTAFACTSKPAEATKYTVAVPNDPTNEARALRLLEANGIIKLSETAGETATKLDIVENPYNVEIVEVEAAQIPSMLKDFDYAVINGNYAAQAGLNVNTDALFREGDDVAKPNILSVKAGNENEPKILALKAALQSQQVVDYLLAHGDLGALSKIANPTDGYDPNLDYDALNGVTITVAASPTPHAILLNEVVKGILAAKGITLEVIEFTDYVQPNNVVEAGEVDANYFQHVPYMNNFNEENGTHIVSVGEVHSEPMGLYGGKQSTLTPFGK